jgi:hypothetical protein
MMDELYAARKQMLEAPTGSREYWRAIRTARSLTADLPDRLAALVSAGARIIHRARSFVSALAETFRDAFSSLAEVTVDAE